MRALTILRHVVIACYLFVTASAFLYTMTRIQVPGIPRQVFLFSYAMMAPYQGDSQWHHDVVAEGLLPDGAWAPIDLNAYYPYGPGEGVTRRKLPTYDKLLGEDERRQKYVLLALNLLDRERRNGKKYEAVRLIAQQWDRSPAGREFLRRAPMMKAYVLAEVR